MKKVMAGLLGLGVMVSVSSAQNPNLTKSAPGVRQQQAQPAGNNMKHKTPDEWVGELDAVVGLSADQKIQAKALAEQTEAKMKALRAEANTDKEALKQKRMQIHKEQKEALDKILNDDQKAKWKAHRMAMMAEHGGHRGHRTPDQVVADLDATVTLTADQKTKVKALAESKDAKMKALMDEQKATPNDAVFQEKRKQIGKEYREELGKILTPEQKAKLKAQMESRKQQHGTPTQNK